MAKKTVLFEGDSWFAYPEDPTGPSNVYQKFTFINTGRSASSQYHIYFQVHPANISAPRGQPLSKNGGMIADIANFQENLQLANILRARKLWALVISGGVDRFFKPTQVGGGENPNVQSTGEGTRQNSTVTSGESAVVRGQRKREHPT